MNCSNSQRSHFQWMLMCSSHFTYISNIQGKLPHYLVENLNVKTTVWFTIDSGSQQTDLGLISLEHEEERINSRMRCTIKYQIAIQLGVMNSVLFPDIRYQVSSSHSIFLNLKCLITLDCTLVHNCNSALGLEKSILDLKLSFGNLVGFAGTPMKTHALVNSSWMSL